MPPKASTASGIKKRKTEKAPQIDKLLFPAIGVCVALLGYQFYSGIAAGSIPRIDPLDDVGLREVFFAEVTGKQSYAVLCHEPDSKAPISSVFSDAFSGGSSPALFRILDCNYVLPESEKTIAERFKLDLKKRPTIFVSGAVGEPKQVPSKHLKTGKMLDKLLKNMLEPRAAKIETTQDLRIKCLNQPYCALLVKGSKSVDSTTKAAIQKLLVEQPKIVFASVDSSNLYIKNLEEYLPELQKGRHRFVVFKKLSGSLDPKDTRIVTSIAPLANSGVSYGQMSNLCAEVMSERKSMTKLTTLPMIKTRTKKVEAEEKLKRERSTQSQKAGSSGSSAPSGVNDGTKDGRRAERERRREEHREKTGAVPKTPEEIAEIERQRRIRMEDAEQAWTVQDGDLPPEGEPVTDEGNWNDLDDDDDDSDEGQSRGDQSVEENDEDVLDLD